MNKEGYVTEMGYDPHNKITYTDEPFTWADFMYWRKVDGVWVKMEEAE